jgi:hypothetical protein
MAGSCADSCCAEKQRAVPVQESMAIFVDVTHATDLENGLSNNEKEHVLLSTSEMTCIGYETKLVQTPGIHPLVRNLKTSLVLSRAEFDLVSAACAVEVTKHLERTTEFKCERVVNRGSSFNLIARGGAFVIQP